jgi:phage-related protein|tara:strand:+ start:5325 stop:5693 length:369 start_codon:yes stop_codon:yes gene_type:complete
MAIGFTVGVTVRTPDKMLARTTNPQVKVASFGDGYEQRLPDGINTLKESYSVSFSTQPKADIDDIVAFFDTNKGVVPFNFTIPDTNAGGGEKTIKVVCPTWNQVYDYGDYYSCTATFKRVYE